MARSAGRYVAVAAVCLALGAAAGAESPADPCAIRPTYLEWKVGCADGAGAVDRGCPWVPALDALWGGRFEAAAGDIRTAFDLAPGAARQMAGAASIYAPLLVSSPWQCQTASTPEMQSSFLSGLLQGGGLERQLVTLLLSGTRPDSAVRWAGEQSDKVAAGRALSAAQSLRAALVAAVGEDTLRDFTPGRLLAQAEATAVERERRVLPPPSAESWSFEVHFPGLDATLARAAGESTMAERFAALAEVIRAESSDLGRAMLWTRAGVGLFMKGLEVEALTVFAWAERAFERVELEADSPLRFARALVTVQKRRLHDTLEMGGKDSVAPTLALSPSLDVDDWLAVMMEAPPAIPPEQLFAQVARLSAERPLGPDGEARLHRAFELAVPGWTPLWDESGAAAEPDLRGFFLGRWLEQWQASMETAEARLHGGAAEALDAWLAGSKGSFRLVHHELGASVLKGALRRGDGPTALRAAEALIDFGERGFDPLWVDGALGGALELRNAGFYRIAVDLSAADGETQRAFAFAERGRAMTLRRLLGTRPGQRTAGDREALARTVGLLKKGAGAEEISETQNEFLSSRLEEKLLSPKGDDIASFPRPVELERLRGEVLASDETLLAYFPGDRGLHVWAVGRGRFYAWRLPWSGGAPKEIEALSVRARSAPSMGECRQTRGAALNVDCTPAAGALGDGASRRSARVLFERLLAPIWDSLPAGGRLIVVPFGVLHGVPWAALEAPGGQLVLDRFAVSAVPSTDALATLRLRTQLAPTARAISWASRAAPDSDGRWLCGSPSTTAPSPGASCVRKRR
ncbi:MAG: CHAT domain-containing protein, partial [Acidobacteriota bacterium]